MTTYQIGSTYSFQVYPVAQLGNNFQNVVVLAVLDATTVQQLGIDIWGMHMQLYPSLPEGTPNDPTQYQYIRIKLQSGQTTILAVPWIDDSTVELVSAQTLAAVISNIDAATWAPRIQLALVQLLPPGTPVTVSVIKNGLLDLNGLKPFGQSN